MQRLLLVALVALLAVTGALKPTRRASAAEHPDGFVLEAFPNASLEVEFIDSWGARRPGGRRHKGTDIKSPRGTPVVAAAEGTVIFVGKGRGAGYYVKVEHADGWVTVYMHLNNDSPGTDDGRGGPDTAFAPGLEVGDLVAAGQLIGFVGDSGNAEHTVPHTHFEVRHDGHAINPYDYLVEALDARMRPSMSRGLVTR